jgi:hypothetical protein
MFSADGINWQASTANADYDLSYQDGVTSYLVRDQSAVHYLWRDETASLHTAGDTTLPQWNLGFLASTDSPPITREDAYYKIYLKKAPVRLDLTDGDKIHFTPYWSIDPTKTIDAMMQVSEHLNLTKSPAWYQEIKSIIMFNSTEGGALPSTIERVAAYTPLVSTGFDGNLTPAVNNLQALAQAVDDLDLTGGAGAIPISTAGNDFQVGSGVGTWIKKTLAEVKTILGLGTAAYTASANYAVAAKGVTSGDSHAHTGGAGAQIAYSSLSGLPTLKQMITGTAMSNTVPAGATYYILPGHAIVPSSSSYNQEITAACTISDLRLTCGKQPATGSLVVTLMKNNVATALTITIPAGYAGGTLTDLVNSVSFSPGDFYILRLVNNATATSGTITRNSLLATFS